MHFLRALEFERDHPDKSLSRLVGRKREVASIARTFTAAVERISDASGSVDLILTA